MALALTLTISTVHGEVIVEITGRCSKEEFELQNETDLVQSISERCELTMFNLSRKTPQGLARKRKRNVRVRRVLMRHPYLVGIATTAVSIVLERAVDYCMSGIWQLLNNTIRRLLM